SIPHGPRGGGAGGGDRGAGLAAAPLESQQHRLRRRAQAGAGVGLARPPTSLWASGRFAAYHTVDGRRVYDGSSTRRWRRRWHARAEGSVDGQVAARRARGALDWETTSLRSLDPVLMIVHD
ncbi:hypothetical protein EMIHUDRAFT_362310, partial [Emiliania huxleyi CCMP1516]|uniref:Uncharacterized protein n=2 Tax=Emiliania huxleyi TaxID=2903 RepID=A0A0D3KMQ1_EMIH1